MPISKRIATAVALTLCLAFLVATAWAGSDLDFGSLPGAPVQANYIAWLGNTNPPTEILTEDGFNSALGFNQGYQGAMWLLAASNFTTPAPTEGVALHFVFGGLGADSGTTWTYDTTWTGSQTFTDHGMVGVSASAACPVQLQGSWDGANKTVNWTGEPSDNYHIYRSQQASGAGNNGSNGRYLWRATVSTDPSGNGTYVDNTATVPTWHIVVPANPDGSIAGCHSEESTPTAVSLGAMALKGADGPARPPVAPIAVFLALAAISLLAWRRRPATTRSRRD